MEDVPGRWKKSVGTCYLDPLDTTLDVVVGLHPYRRVHRANRGSVSIRIGVCIGLTEAICRRS